MVGQLPLHQRLSIDFYHRLGDSSAKMQMEGMSGGTYYGVLHASDVDFANITQVETFLHELKHLEYLPILGARYAEYFWYGIIVLLVVVAVINRVYSLVRRLR